MMLICRHCMKSKANRPRQMCWTCYYTPGVREMYPSTSKFAVRGVKDTPGGYAMPEPTTAKPNTPEKLAVLEERAARRQRLWHPDDAKH